MFNTKYFIQTIYKYVSREDHIATLSIFPKTKIHKLYSINLTVVFQYTQKELLGLEIKFKDKNIKTISYAK